MPKFFLSVVMLLAEAFSAHPLHVSICEIEYDRDARSLEIIQRIFIDDIEEEIRGNLEQPELDITAPNNGKSTDDLLEEYVLGHLTLTVNGKNAQFNYLGHEIEGDAFFCYLEIEKVKKLKSLKVESSVLINLHEDQVNIVHVKLDGKSKSMKLSSRQRFDEFKYN